MIPIEGSCGHLYQRTQFSRSREAGLSLEVPQTGESMQGRRGSLHQKSVCKDHRETWTIQGAKEISVVVLLILS